MLRTKVVGADLTKADFSWAIVEEADFTGVTISGTSFRSAQLRDVKGIRFKKKGA
jgi:uncharacterized protein YjbI with pentapeptide repeats